MCDHESKGATGQCMRVNICCVGHGFSNDKHLNAKISMNNGFQATDFWCRNRGCTKGKHTIEFQVQSLTLERAKLSPEQRHEGEVALIVLRIASDDLYGVEVRIELADYPVDE